ncbi:hypothetical protein KFE80_07125 [bacterium SCSIO 12696]|nr:hypothetical protein KFE80_07125 [bacterium SCSIO 12696]
MEIKNYFKGRAIKKFMAKLSQGLQSRYGSSESYTVGQVQKTVDALKLNSKYIDFAIFVFCDPEEHKKSGFHLEKINKYEGYADKFFYGACGASSCGSSIGGEGSCGGGSD